MAFEGDPTGDLVPKIIAAGFAVVAIGTGCASEVAELSSGDVTVRVETQPLSIVMGPLRMTGAEATVDRYTLGSQIIPGWDAYQPNHEPWRVPQVAELVDSDDTSATVQVTGEGVELEITVQIMEGRVRLSQRSILDTDATERNIKSAARFDLGADERFFGMGERYASVDHRGQTLYNWAEEAGIGQGETAPVGPENPYPNGPSMTYFPVPFYLSSAGYGLHVDSSYRSEIDFGAAGDALRVEVSASTYALVIYPDPDPLVILDRFTEDTGRPMVPADWVFGPRRRTGRGSRVDGVPEWRALRERGVPTTGIDDSMHFLPHNSHVGIEAELSAWTTAMHAQGFKVMAYNNPYVSESEARAAGIYSEGKDSGYFVLDASGQPGLTVFISGKLQNIAAVDFTNPAAVTWFEGLLRRTLDLGYDGWMHDFGEYIERDWSFLDGRRGDEVHNLYPLMSAKAAHDLLIRERPGDFLFFVRSGWTGTQAFVPAVWSGDPEATFDETQGLPAMLRGGINLGLSGVPLWGSDISGFKCFTDDPKGKEMYLRWGQLGAVSPIMMDQNACNAVTGRRDKWTLWSDAETTANYGAMARLHTRLQPYFLILAQQAHAEGVPMMRHPFLMFPSDAGTYGVEDAFFLGPALYAAPVVRRGVRTRTVYLPAGTYVDLDDLTVHAGGREISVPAPLTKLPLFLVSGQLLPMLDPSIQTLAPATEAGVVTPAAVADRLDVRVALKVGESASLELVDGTKLTAERVATSAGNPMSLTETSSTSLAECASCYRAATAGGVGRLQVNSAMAAEAAVVFDDVRVTHSGGLARRIRWDVLRL